ncbi:MAG TPA: hypothetical protein VFY76_12240, partial [Nocardioides sp.]|nr:hypothetical protein [Nocardioides sp.]
SVVSMWALVRSETAGVVLVETSVAVMSTWCHRPRAMADSATYAHSAGGRRARGRPVRPTRARRARG